MIILIKTIQLILGFLTIYISTTLFRNSPDSQIKLFDKNWFKIIIYIFIGTCLFYFTGKSNLNSVIKFIIEIFGYMMLWYAVDVNRPKEDFIKFFSIKWWQILILFVIGTMLINGI